MGVVAECERVAGAPGLVSDDANLLFFRVLPWGPAKADFRGLEEVHSVAALPPAAGACNIDTVRGRATENQITLASGEQVEISGWAGDVRRGLAPRTASIYLVSERERLSVLGHMGFRRDDVAAAFGKKDLAESGFIALVPVDKIPPDTYTVSIGFSDAGGQWACPTGYKI